MKKIRQFIPESQSKWLKLIDILQNELNLDVYPGGDSAMTGWHHRHDAIFYPTTEDLYGVDVHKIPNELLKENWERKFYLYENTFLPKDLGIHKIKTQGYKLRIPSVERALLEMVYDLDIRLSFDTIFEYFLDVHWVNPKRFEKLLIACKSEKIKRLAIFLSEETGFEYYEKINFSKIDLNLKQKINYASNENCFLYMPKYNIEVPIQFRGYHSNYEEHYNDITIPRSAV